jgi:hypothetical protein
MRTSVILLSITSLFGGLLASWRYFQGSLPEADFHLTMTVVTLVWFAGATYWAYHRKP